MTPLGRVGLARTAIKRTIMKNIDLILTEANSIRKEEGKEYLTNEEKKLVRDQIGSEIKFLNNNYGTINDIN